MKLFIDHFLNFQQEFICLETIQLIDITYFTFYLLINVSSLLFINENINVLIQNFIKETLERQRNILTKLSLDDDNVFESINLPFYQLTYLTIDYCSSSILSHIVKNLIPSITHLDISIDQLDLDTKRTCPDLSCLSSSLTHLTLRIGSDFYDVSIEWFKQYSLRLRQCNFTYRCQTDSNYKSVILSIGDKRFTDGN
ncbi:unnamed protein product [Rotaria sp. Silwood1]|nr:unnamed protein product [Rotaria sp. Silwood1]